MKAIKIEKFGSPDVLKVENVEIDKYLEIVMNIVAGAVKGFVLVALLLFIFDTVPMSYKTKDLINNKIGEKNIRRLFLILFI